MLKDDKNLNTIFQYTISVFLTLMLGIGVANVMPVGRVSLYDKWGFMLLCDFAFWVALRLLARCVNIWHICVTVCAKRSDGPERRPLEGARMRHQRPCRRPLRPERAALALWVTPVHASSMVESTADDHLTVDGDAMFVVGADPEHTVRTH